MNPLRQSPNQRKRIVKLETKCAESFTVLFIQNICYAVLFDKVTQHLHKSLLNYLKIDKSTQHWTTQ